MNISAKSVAAPGRALRARKLDVAGFVLGCITGGLSAIVRRIFRGAARPSWGWKFEFVVGVQAATYRSLVKLGVERYNPVVEAILPKASTAGATLKESTDPALPGHWLIPEHDSGAVVLYLHGGGYVYGSIGTHAEMMGALAQASSARVFALDYRLAPRHPQPAAVEDTCAAYRGLLEEGIAPSKIVLAGDSAGGGLVLAALVALRDAGDPQPAGGVAISPWVALECSGESFQANAALDPVSREACLTAAAAYLAGSDARAPHVSPLFADLSGLPPLLLHVGEVEVLLDQVKAFAERAVAMGVDARLEVYPDMVHVWHMLLSFTPQAALAISDIAAFVDKVVNRPGGD